MSNNFQFGSPGPKGDRGPQGATGPAGPSGSTTLFFANLASTSASGATTVFLGGYAVAGDNGGGAFTWNPTSTATPDGGTVSAGPGGTGVPGRWIRNVPASTWYNVVHYGADPTGGTDSAPGIQRAITAAQTAISSGIGSITVFFPKGLYVINSPISVRWTSGAYGIHFLGEGKGATGGQLSTIRASFTVPQGTTGTISSIAANPNPGISGNNVPTMTDAGAVNLASASVGDTVSVSNGAVNANNVNGTVLSVTAGSHTFTYDGWNPGIYPDISTSGNPTTTGETHNGSLHWKILPPMFRNWSRDNTFENLFFDGNGTAGCAVDSTSDTTGTGVVCTNMQFKNCTAAGMPFGFKNGDYGPNSAHPFNCELFRFEKCFSTNATITDTLFYTPNATSQAKLYHFVDCASGFERWGIRFQSGSFNIDHFDFEHNSVGCIQLVSPSDACSVKNFRSEASPHLLVLSMGALFGASSLTANIHFYEGTNDWTSIDASHPFFVDTIFAGGLTFDNVGFGDYVHSTTGRVVGMRASSTPPFTANTGVNMPVALFRNCIFPFLPSEADPVAVATAASQGELYYETIGCVATYSGLALSVPFGNGKHFVVATQAGNVFANAGTDYNLTDNDIASGVIRSAALTMTANVNWIMPATLQQSKKILLDLTQVTFSGHTITLKTSGGTAWGTVPAAVGLWEVFLGMDNHLHGVALT